MRSILSTIQAIAITVVCALLAAKILESEQSGFSMSGALVGGGIAVIAILIQSRFRPTQKDNLVTPTKAQILLLRCTLGSVFAALVFFTATLYFPSVLWIRIATGISVVVGVVCVFANPAYALLSSSKGDA
jgi:uncharacterized membrane protein